MVALLAMTATLEGLRRTMPAIDSVNDFLAWHVDVCELSPGMVAGFVDGETRQSRWHGRIDWFGVPKESAPGLETVTTRNSTAA